MWGEKKSFIRFKFPYKEKERDLFSERIGRNKIVSNCLQLSQAKHNRSKPHALGLRVHILSSAAVSPSFWVSTIRFLVSSLLYFYQLHKVVKREVLPRLKHVSFFLSWACSLACMLACFPVLGWHLKDGRALSVRVQKLHIEEQKALGEEAAPPDRLWTLLVQARVVFLDPAFQAVLPPAGWDVLSSSQHIHTALTPLWLTFLRSRWEMVLELSEDKNHDKHLKLSLNILTGFLWELRPKQHLIL